MKKALIIVGALIVLIVVILLVLPFVIPVSAYKDRIIALVEQSTGRKFAINGPMSLTLLPRTALEVSDVTFGNPPGVQGDMLRLGKLQLQVSPIALLSGELQIDSFVLVDPKIALAVDKNGHPNWELTPAPAGGAAPAGTAATAPAAKPPAANAPAGSTPAASGGGGSALKEIHLGDIRLVNGQLSYSDARSGQKQQIDAINLKLALPDLEHPMQASGQAKWNGKVIDLTVGLDKPGAFLAGESSKVNLKIASPVNFAFNGTIAQRPEMHLAGDTNLDIPSFKELAAWTGATLPPTSGGLNTLKIAGTFDHMGNKTSFKNAQIALDQMNAKGDLAIDMGGVRPALKGALDIDKLDLNPYLPPDQSAGAKPAAGGGTAPAGGGAPAKPAAAPAPAAPAAASEGWSDAPIDVSGLKAADADFALTVGGIVFKKIKIGQSALAVQLKDGRLAADLSKMQLYDGSGKGTLKLDGSSGVPALDGGFTLDKVQAEPLLKDAIDLDRFSGNANGDMTMQSTGKSQRELIGNLGGKGAIRFANGAIKGINIGALVGTVKNALSNPASLGNLLVDAKSQSNDSTQFTELTGTYTITKGVLDNKDMKLDGPLVHATGAGNVNLPAKTIEYRIEADQIPIIVSGPWDKISYRPDAQALLKQPGKLLQGVGDVLKGGTAPSAQSGSTGTGTPSQKPGDLLKGLLGAPKN